MPTDESISIDGEEKPEQQATESVGEILAAERARQNLSEKEVADQLHITMHYVKAIESNSFEKLPGAVFAKGYIKSYALLLGLEEERVLASYEGYVSDQQDAAREKTRIQVRRRKDKNRPWVIGSALAFVSLFIGLWVLNSESGDASQLASSQPPPAAAQQAPVNSAIAEPEIAIPDRVDETVSLVEAQQILPPQLASDGQPGSETLNDSQLSQLMPAPSLLQESSLLEPAEDEQLTTLLETSLDSRESGLPLEAQNQRIQVEAQGEDLLLITFSGESWIEVSDGFDNQIYRDLREAGDILEITGTPPFNILLGDAPFAQVMLNGTAIDVSDDIRIDNSARLTVGL